MPQEEAGAEPEVQEERWPKDVIEKHHQRQEAAKKISEMKIEQKRQRLIKNGVPAEKRPI